MECVPLPTRPDVAADSVLVAPRSAPLLLTIPEAADLLALSRATLYRLIADGQIETLRIGGVQRIRPRALDRFLDAVERRSRERAVGLT